MGLLDFISAKKLGKITKSPKTRSKGFRFGSWTDDVHTLGKHKAKRRIKMKMQKASRAANR